MSSLLTRPLKKAADRLISRLASWLPDWDDAVSEPAMPAVSAGRVVAPLNAASLPAAVAAYFEVPVAVPASRLFTLHQVYVSWHAVVFRRLHIFLPSLALRTWKNYYTDSYLLKQWGRLVEPVPEMTLALVHDQWTRTNYYHWMVDGLSRLLLLRAHYPGSTLIMPQPSGSYVEQTARLLGFEKFVYLTEGEVLRAPTLLLPAHVAPPGLHHPGLLCTIRQELTAGLNLEAARPTRRIYVSRARQKVRRLANEEALLAAIQPHGFECVYFEEMSFVEQVQLMRETQVLLGVHGANLVNLLFLPAGSIVLELSNEDKLLKLANANFENLIYYRMCVTLGLPYGFLPCRTAAGQLPSNDADVAADVAAVTHLLQRLLSA